ncbi:MAG: glycosyltransferase [Myxococcota bacterium]
MIDSQFFAAAIVGTHFALLAMLSLFGLHRLVLVFLRSRGASSRPVPKREEPASWPRVTVQIPLYNEPAVARRCIEAVAALDYPVDRLEIQVLDDSTDETQAIVQRVVANLVDKGIQIECLHREDRTGFKAGALAEGLRVARGEFVAVFDADFVPPPHFLKHAIPHFQDADVGMVQTRWGHLNREANALTEVQAIRLDAHFCVEQQARAGSDLHFNFNGTAGIWRREAIGDAGGWRSTTLTEDLDLSYRAQLRGWRFVYLPDLQCPAEIPTDLAALESQQHRWAKGSTQVFLKLAPSIWRSSWRFHEKLEATFHLAGNLAYLVMVVDSIAFLVPSLVLRQALGWERMVWLDVPLLLLSTGGHVCFFVAGQRFAGRSLGRSLRNVPTILATGVGLALNDARAVLEALLGRQSEFVRTPKTGELEVERREEESLPGACSPGTRLRSKQKPTLRWSELALGLTYGGVAIWATLTGLWAAVPFLVLLHVGFLGSGLHPIVARA